MKRLVSLAVAVVVLAAAFLVLGCAPKEQAKMTVWINGADSYIGPTEKELPQDQWYISQAFKRFEKANPGRDDRAGHAGRPGRRRTRRSRPPAPRATRPTWPTCGPGSRSSR